MSRIEDTVGRARYERDPYYSYRYDAETVDAIEALVGQPLPEDIRWYLLNIGSWKFEYDYSAVLVARGDALLNLRFKGVEDQVFFKSRYEHYLDRREGARLPGNPALYYPLCEISGEFRPSVTLRLLVDLNEGEDFGSIWGVRPIGYHDDQTPSKPIRLADDFATFIEQVGSERNLQAKAEKNNEALFKRLFASEIKKPSVIASSASTPEILLQGYFDRREETIFDGARNVEFDHYVSGRRFETSEDIKKSAIASGHEMPTNAFQSSTAVVRRAIRFGVPTPYNGGFVGQKLSKGFMTKTVKSTIGDNLTFDEQYLLYYDAKSGLWTIVRRLEGTIKDVRVKGIGTFGFDTTYKWHLKKKVAPVWAEFKCELHVGGEEDALTAEVIELITEILNKASFRKIFEDHVFHIYRERYYAEFEAMDAEEKKDWIKDFPQISSSQEIWPLLGRKASIQVYGGRSFTIQVEAGFDPEHGLNIRVENWKIV